MADSLLLPTSLEQITGSDDAIFVAGVYVYDAGTTDLKNVYTDATLLTAADNPIIADGDGVIPARYIGTGSYKLVIKDTEGYPTEDLSEHWTTFKTIDNLPGALDTSTFASDEATPITPVVSKTSDFVVLTSQQGSVFDSDPTGGNITATLPSAVTAGDNFRITFKHTGTANSVIITTVSAQTIDGEPTYTLEDQYEGVTLVSDGANWLISESARLSPPASDYPPGHLYGLVCSNAADTTNDITVTAGSCRDSTNAVNLDLENALTKQMDASWVAGTNAGGRSSAGLADGTWNIFVIGKANGADADVFFHNTLTPGPDDDDVLPTDYLYYRLLIPFLRISSANIQFTQDDDFIRYKTPILDIEVTNLGGTSTTFTLSVPTGFSFRALCNGMASASSNSAVYIRNPSDTDLAGSSTASPLATIGSPNSSSSIAAQFEVRTNTSKQIEARSSTSGTTLRVATLGYWLPKGVGA